MTLLAWIYIYFVEKKYYLWVRDYWFYKRSRISKISTLFLLLGMFLLLLSLLDLRDVPQKIETKIPLQKTIIMIDTSASMLAEDIHPNRLHKAILIARHFLKNIVGHQVSVLLFSDFTKSLIPFTEDYDLLDARLAGAMKLVIKKGGLKY